MAAPETASPPQSNETPVLGDALRLVRVPFSPGAVFRELQDRPRFWVPYAIASVAAAVLGVLMIPFNRRVTEAILERLNRPVPPASPLDTVKAIAGAPIILLIVCAVSGGILYLVASSLGGETTYKKMLSVVIHAWPLFFAQQLLAYIVLSMRGLDAIHGPMDMIVSLGADLALPSDAQVGYFLRFFLGGIGPLQIWQLVISAVGVGIMARAGKGAAWTAATVNYLFWLLLLSGLGAFGMKMAGG